jgi:MFS transporter, OFA family, oxalate/formate antiporter
VTGYLVDRLGARALALFGVIVVGVGFLLFSRINSLGALYASYVIAGVGASACMGVTPMTNIAHWFLKKRGRAMGFFMVGAGLGGALVPVVTWLLGIHHWRTVLLILAIGTWIIGIPLALILKHSPEKYGMQPDGAKEPSSKDIPGAQSGFTIRQALKDRSFWLFSFVFALSFASINAVTLFLIPYLTDPKSEKGLALTGILAGSAVTVTSFVSLAGRLGSGWMSENVNQKYLLMILFLMQAASLVTLAFVGTIWHLVPFFILYSISFGGIIALRPVVLVSYYGRRSLGAIHGLCMAIMTVGGVLSPILVGLLRDSTGSYFWPFIVLSVTTVVAVPLLFFVRRSPQYTAT